MKSNRTELIFFFTQWSVQGVLLLYVGFYVKQIKLVALLISSTAAMLMFILVISTLFQTLGVEFEDSELQAFAGEKDCR